MATILLLLKDARNRRLLANWLASEHNVVSSSNPEDLDRAFDLAIVGGRALQAHATVIAARKASAAPALLPFLLVTTRPDLGSAGRQVWEIVDDVVAMPAHKVELQARVRSLLSARAYSVALQERNDDLQAFVHAVTHDLRAPARISAGFAEALQEDYADRLDDQAMHYIDRIRSADNRMLDLLDLLVRFARLGSGGVTPRPVPLQPVIAGILAAQREAVDAQRAEVVVTSQLPEVYADPELLDIALSNLLTNALKFVAAGVRPRIEITSRTGATPGTCRLEVTDNGIGIAADDLQRIFDTFVRLHGEETYAGIGLGLPTARKAVTLMNGTLGVSSQPQVGSTFWIELPIAEGQTPCAP